MKLDGVVLYDNLREVGACARAAEEMGFEGLWTGEAGHEGLLPMTLMAEHTRKVKFGSSVAVAFSRSPTIFAMAAWDLAAQSDGRFILGLGTQVKAHVERRFGMPWESPAPKLKDMILAIRAVWDCWQNGTPLNYRGQFYKLTLMTPYFGQRPIATPKVPIFVSGVNPIIARTAAEVADGFIFHPLHSAKYLAEIILPAIETGLARSGRTRADFQILSPVFTVTNKKEREAVRNLIAFYASTPNYRRVLECHGWTEMGERLSPLASAGKWQEMAHEVTDEMVDTFAVVAAPEELPAKLLARCDGSLDRIVLDPFRPGEKDRYWQALVEAINGRQAV